MALLDRLEAKLGKYAVQNMTLALLGAWVIVFVLVRVLGNQELAAVLVFHPSLVLAGDYWRVVSFMLFPPTLSLLWFIFMAMLYYLFGSAMETTWGAFRYNCYLLCGWALTLVAGFTALAIAPFEPSTLFTTSHYVLEAVFLGFALLYPDYVINLFLVLPIKVKWLALIGWGHLVYVIAAEPVAQKLFAVACVLNVLLFFWPKLLLLLRRQRRAAGAALEQRQAASTPFNTCHVCGVTDLKDPDRIFRVDSSLEGSPDICLPCLEARKHEDTAGP